MSDSIDETGSEVPEPKQPAHPATEPPSPWGPTSTTGSEVEAAFDDSNSAATSLEPTIEESVTEAAKVEMPPAAPEAPIDRPGLDPYRMEAPAEAAAPVSDSLVERYRQSKPDEPAVRPLDRQEPAMRIRPANAWIASFCGPAPCVHLNRRSQRLEILVHATVHVSLDIDEAADVDHHRAVLRPLPTGNADCPGYHEHPYRGVKGRRKVRNGVISLVLEREIILVVVHHSKHHQGYITKVNAAIEGSGLASKSIEDLISDLSAVAEDKRGAVRNNGGGHANHSLFWTVMGPGKGGQPGGDLAAAINSAFGSFDAMKEQFGNAAAYATRAAGYQYGLIGE